ncbi:Uncharacterised protein [uncultured Blautia sp.]
MGKYIWNLYVNRFYGKRNLVLFVILWIAFDSFYAEIDYACKVLDYPCSFWYFLNVMTNHFMCGAIGLSAVYLFSNAPYLNRNGMYQMIRQGKYKWLLSQLGSIILSGFSFTAVLFFTGWIRMLPHMDWTWSWGRMMKTLAVTNAASQLNVTFVLKPSFMQSMEAWQAGLLAFMLDSFVFILIGFLLLAIGLLCNRMTALIFTGILAIVPFVTNSWNLSRHLMINLFSPVSWLQTGLFYTENMTYAEMPPVLWIWGMLAVYLALAVVLALLAAKRNHFQWNGEEE